MQMRGPGWAVPLFSPSAEPSDEHDVTDMRNVDPRWQPDNVGKNVEAVRKPGDLAAAKGLTVSQLALAWHPR
jgi:aryl-alcohol dehydrogenase-like predicted oxidoreductase